MKKKFLVFAAMVGMCALGLLSCKDRTEFSGGKALSSSEMQALIDSSKEPVDAEENAEPATPLKETYYFVAGNGTVYHNSAACSYLKNSQGVQSGSLKEAFAAGKERLCSACAKAQVGEQSTAASSDTREDGVCFYTAGGSVWHYDRRCSSLARSENVLFGTEEQARLDGKTRPCARCSD